MSAKLTTTPLTLDERLDRLEASLDAMLTHLEAAVVGIGGQPEREPRPTLTMIEGGES